jgi:hypothetical protein
VEPERPHPVSALPSVQARILGFAAIIVAGVCGALIGAAFVHVQRTGSWGVAEGLGGVVGAVIAAGGVAVVVVLVMRAMGEWKTIKDERALDEVTAAAAAGAQAAAVESENGHRPEPD